MLSKDLRLRLAFRSLFLTGESDVNSLSNLKLRFFVWMLKVGLSPSRPFSCGFVNYISSCIKLTC